MTARDLNTRINYIASDSYLLDLLKKNIPDTVKNWDQDETASWPIKIYTLSRFNINNNGISLIFPGRSKRKPLELLRTLIAFGGREVSQHILCEVLWPDSEGDAAHRSFDTTLYRLRQLIGNEKAITLHEGCLSINSDVCWVDAWAFERLQGKIESILDQRIMPDDTADAIGRMSECILRLYQGHFLHNVSDSPYILAFRERLRSKYIRLLRKTGYFWECQEHFYNAVDCYQRGLELDNLVEEFYQRLMICYQTIGLKAESLIVYQRCTQALDQFLGISPSTSTETIRQALFDS